MNIFTVITDVCVAYVEVGMPNKVVLNQHDHNHNKMMDHFPLIMIISACENCVWKHDKLTKSNVTKLHQSGSLLV